MNYEEILIDELVYIRQIVRNRKQWKLSDEIRNYLDTKLAFVFDTKEGQEVYHLSEEYFKLQDRFPETKMLSKRQYVEYKIKQDINADKFFDAWIYSMQQSIKSANKA